MRLVPQCYIYCEGGQKPEALSLFSPLQYFCQQHQDPVSNEDEIYVINFCSPTPVAEPNRKAMHGRKNPFRM